jgi:hypothetical protein
LQTVFWKLPLSLRITLALAWLFAKWGRNSSRGCELSALLNPLAVFVIIALIVLMRD